MTNYGFERDGQKIYVEADSGKEYVLDEMGNKMPPLRSSINKNCSFKTYDTSQGHCCFCGMLTCGGSCFK